MRLTSRPNIERSRYLLSFSVCIRTQLGRARLYTIDCNLSESFLKVSGTPTHCSWSRNWWNSEIWELDAPLFEVSRLIRARLWLITLTGDLFFDRMWRRSPPPNAPFKLFTQQSLCNGIKFLLYYRWPISQDLSTAWTSYRCTLRGIYRYRRVGQTRVFLRKISFSPS